MGVLASAMMSQVRAESERRRAEVSAVTAFDVGSLLFDRQRSVGDSPEQFVTINCGRRSGKSDWAGKRLTNTAVKERPGSRSVFAAPTLGDARDIVWPVLLELNEKFHLGGKVNETRLEIRYPNKSTIKLGSMKDRRDVNRRYRGRHFDGDFMIDECQSIGGHLAEAVQDAIMPALKGRGREGRLFLMGSAGAVEAGFWWEKVHDADTLNPRTGAPLWGHHSWTIRENPFIDDIEGFLSMMAAELGGWESPKFLREYLNVWGAGGDDLLCYRYSPGRNHYDALPAGKRWLYVFGIDLGFRDANAIAVLGWNEAEPHRLYLVDEYVKAKQVPTEFAKVIIEWRDKYQPVAMVADTGGFGKGLVEDWQARADLGHLYLEPAEKRDKAANIDMANGDLITGTLKIRRTSRLAHDMSVVRWDEGEKEKGQRKVAKLPHSDIADAFEYGYRRIQTYVQHEPTPPPPVDEVSRGLRELERLRRERQSGKKKAGAKYLLR